MSPTTNKSRIVVITGATGGLGPAVAQAFRTSGDRVIGIARKAADVEADLTDPAEAERAIQTILREHQRIDVLAHCLGGFAAGDAADVWGRMLSMNLLSAVYAAGAVIPYMKEASRGRIIAVGSRAGAQPSPGIAAYAASKAALHAWIQTLAAELKASGITANAVLPGTIRTEANLSWGTAAQAATWTDPASIAALIHWLASDEAADVSGALIPVYGQS